MSRPSVDHQRAPAGGDSTPKGDASAAPQDGPISAARRRFDPALLLMVPAVIVVVIVFAYPVGAILLRAFTFHESADAGMLANFHWYLGEPVQRTILGRTFVTSAAVTAICLLVCYPFAYVLTTLKGRWLAAAVGIVLIASGQSILVRTFSWKVILRDNGPVNAVLSALSIDPIKLLGTTTGVVVAMCQVMAPFMILALYANMRGIDGRYVQAAMSLGASPLSSFARVYLPLSLPGVAAGSLLVFVLSLGFYITPAVVGSPQNALLSQAIVNEIQTKLDWGHAGAMAVTLLVVTLALLGVIAALTTRRIAVVSGRGVGRQ
jgi:putative spermidine/putrescine transport system permease protein